MAINLVDHNLKNYEELSKETEVIKKEIADLKVWISERDKQIDFLKGNIAASIVAAESVKASATEIEKQADSKLKSMIDKLAIIEDKTKDLGDSMLSAGNTTGGGRPVVKSTINVKSRR